MLFRSRSIQNKVKGNGDCKGVWIVKSRCIESWLHRCTGEFNAVLSRCGVKRTAHRLFDSKPDLASEVLSMTVAERPLAAEDVCKISYILLLTDIYAQHIYLCFK